MNERDRGGLLGLPKGFRDRTLVTARLATKLGTAALKKQLGFGQGEQDEAEAEAQAVELVAQLGKLKGVAMKIGQMASYLPGSMPPAAQRVLSQLQDHTDPMAPEVIDRLIEDELGKKPASLFEHFEPTPFAAASIGQVHLARHEGQKVAVKIQYPGIEDVLRGDLRMANLMLSMMSTGTAVDGKRLVDELTSRILEECDYVREAKNTGIFRGLLGQDERRKVPTVIAERSTKRVLTTEHIDGMSFGRFAESASQGEKDEAGQVLFDACFHLVFRHALFNADPHPGNYLFLPGGRVAFLDFGCARAFDASMINTWKEFARGMVAGDRKRFPERFAALGFARLDDKKFDWDAQWEATRFLYKPFLEKDYRFESSYLSESYDILMFKNPNKMRLAMPPEWLFLNRLQWGLFAVLNGLKARGPWRELWVQHIEGPTEPAAL